MFLPFKKKVLLITNLLAIAILVFVLFKLFKSQHSSNVCLYELKYFDFHYKKETDSPAVIMLGNSLIRQGDWQVLLARKDVINRGIEGDKMRCICERLSYLKGTSAKVCFVEGGINDLPAANSDSIVNNYQEVVTFLNGEKIKPVLNMILFISPSAGKKYPGRKNYKEINTEILKINNKLKNYCDQNQLDYVDLNSKLSNNKELILNEKYTVDGVHLNKDAYQVWAAEIKNILNKNRI